MKTRFYAVAVMALTLAACNNNDEIENPLANGPVAMNIRASIGAVATRAAEEEIAFNYEDAGIIPIKDGSVETTQNNLQYKYESSTFTATTPYYFQDMKTVTFNAYSPWRELKDNNNVIAIETNANNQSTENRHKNDLLFASMSTDVKNATVNFTGENAFKHVMTQLSFNFKAGTNDGIANLEKLTAYTVKGLTLKGSFNLVDGTLALGEAGGDKGDISMSVTGTTDTEITCNALIVLPQTPTDSKLNVEVIYNDVTYKAALTLSSLAAGTHYTLPVTIKNTELVIGEAKIKPWITTTVEDAPATLN